MEKIQKLMEVPSSQASKKKSPFDDDVMDRLAREFAEKANVKG